MSKPEGLSPVGEGVLGWAVACSRAGASHRRSGQPCQDAHALWSGSVGAMPCLAVAVADGHGDARHDRSRDGAALAAWAAIEELIGLHRHFGADGQWAQLKSSFKTDFPRRLGRRWREMVLADAAARGEDNSDPQTLLTRYGTTLLAALVAGDVLLVGQLGDGGTYLLRPDAAVECPVPGGDSDVGVVTESLCSKESHRLWRTATLERAGGGLLLLATDGLVNAFADEAALHTFLRSLGERIREYGPDAVASSLPGWLDRFSETGSGDDITLALVALRPAAELLRPRNEVDDDVADDRTASAGGNRPQPTDGEEEAR